MITGGSEKIGTQPMGRPRRRAFPDDNRDFVRGVLVTLPVAILTWILILAAALALYWIVFG